MTVSVLISVFPHASSSGRIVDIIRFALASGIVASVQGTLVLYALWSGLLSRYFWSQTCNLLRKHKFETELRHHPSTFGAKQKIILRSLVQRYNKVEPYFLQSLSVWFHRYGPEMRRKSAKSRPVYVTWQRQKPGRYIRANLTEFRRLPREQRDFSGFHRNLMFSQTYYITA